MNCLRKSEMTIPPDGRAWKPSPTTQGRLGGEKEEHMKHGKRPTVKQKKLMTQWHLNYENWLVVKDTPDAMTIVHRATGNMRVIKKGE